MAFFRDLRLAYHSLKRSKSLAAIVILTLALGIGANAAIFTLVRGVLLKHFDIPYMGQAALATHWDRTSPEQRERFLKAVVSSEARAYTDRFSQYWIQSLNDETASLSVLIYNFSTLPYDYQIKLAWTASLVLVALVTITNVTAQLVFSKRHR